MEPAAPVLCFECLIAGGTVTAKATLQKGIVTCAKPTAAAMRSPLVRRKSVEMSSARTLVLLTRREMRAESDNNRRCVRKLREYGEICWPIRTGNLGRFFEDWLLPEA